MQQEHQPFWIVHQPLDLAWHGLWRSTQTTFSLFPSAGWLVGSAWYCKNINCRRLIEPIIAYINNHLYKQSPSSCYHSLWVDTWYSVLESPQLFLVLSIPLQTPMIREISHCMTLNCHNRPYGWFLTSRDNWGLSLALPPKTSFSNSLVSASLWSTSSHLVSGSLITKLGCQARYWLVSCILTVQQ